MMRNLLPDLTNAITPESFLGRHCPVCGYRSRPGSPWKLAPELVESWQLDRKWKRLFERREGFGCRKCGSVERFQYLARVIMEEFDAKRFGCDNFSQYSASPHFRRLSVAEINGCGALHGFLDRNPSLAYSEYGSEHPDVPSENLLALSYEDQAFDLVVTSDTLEHVPDLAKALAEIERILKPGGRHIFTVPVVWDGRKTIQRAVLEGERIIHVRAPSYHGVWDDHSPDRLVFHEFGDDVLEYLQTPGTDIAVKQYTANPSLCVFLAVRVRDS